MFFFLKPPLHIIFAPFLGFEVKGFNILETQRTEAGAKPIASLVMDKFEVFEFLKHILDENITESEEHFVPDISTAEYLVEGVLMFGMGLVGIFLNTISVVFFIRQRSQKTFHR